MTDEDLAAGIRECAEAASEELSSLLQEELLRSVRFGEGFLQLAGEGQQSIIAGIVQKLRVLNAVRSAEIGLFLTTAEYECLKEKAVLARLRDDAESLTLLLPLDADPAPFLAALPSANPAL